MPFVTSKDGTRIAYEKRDQGPALLLVDGAMCSRQIGPMPAIADALSDQFTVWIYDRRGRGESSDTKPYRDNCEIEDVKALVNAAGGTDKISIFGISSGAILAAKAAQHLPGLQKLALFEAPMITDNTHPPMSETYVAETQALVDAGRSGDAAKKFMRYIGMPGLMITFMSWLPVWKKITLNGHTLPYDFSFVAHLHKGKPLDPDEWSGITAKTLIMDGSKSPTYMRNAQAAWAKIIPGAIYETLQSQSHNVQAKVIAPKLRAFFKEPSSI